MNTIRMGLVGLAFIGVLLLPVASASGGEISGTVTDSLGVALPGVTVSLSAADARGASQETVTDPNGVYRFFEVARGEFGMSFRLPGYAPEAVSPVPLADGELTIQNATLAASNEASITVDVVSGTTSVMTNRANVTTSTMEANPGDESASEDTTITTQADLMVGLSASATPVVAGTEMFYSVVVSNAGPSVARFVEVTDTLPAGVTFGSTIGCAEDPDGLPVCTLGPIAPASSAEYKMAVTVDPSTIGVLLNQVSVNSQTVEIGPGNESASEKTPVDTRADLVMTRSHAPDPVVAGTSLVYTTTVANNGPSDAREVVIEDSLPARVTLEATAGCAEDPAAIPNCSLGTIPAGGSRRYTMAVLVDPAGPGVVVDQARVRSATAEASPGDESISAEAEVAARADLAVEVESPDQVIAGTQVSYAVTVKNKGPSNAQGVVLTVTLPEASSAGFTSGCSEDPGGFPTCSLGVIPAGGFRQVTAVASVDSAALGVITTDLSAGSQTPEADPDDDSIARDVTVETRADLVITSRDSVDPVIAGRPLTYTVEVLNNGPSDARDVVVHGELPSAVTFEATDGCAEDGKPAGGVAACTLGAIPAKSSKGYRVAVLVAPDATGVITNRASVTSSTIEARPGDESVPPQPPENPGPASDGPTNFLQQWARAWSGKRVEEYLGCYSDEFRPPNGMSRSNWEASRRSRIETAQWIEVQVRGFEVEMLAPERARVTFDQIYRSDRFGDSVRKTIELAREEGRWTIVAERVGG